MIRHATPGINGPSVLALRPVILPVADHCWRCRHPAEVDCRPDGPRFDLGPTTVVRDVQGNLQVQSWANVFWAGAVQVLRVHGCVFGICHGSGGSPHQGVGAVNLPQRAGLSRTPFLFANPFCRGISMSPMTRPGCNFAASSRAPLWRLYSRCEQTDKSSPD